MALSATPLKDLANEIKKSQLNKLVAEGYDVGYRLKLYALNKGNFEYYDISILSLSEDNKAMLKQLGIINQIELIYDGATNRWYSKEELTQGFNVGELVEPIAINRVLTLYKALQEIKGAF